MSDRDLLNGISNFPRIAALTAATLLVLLAACLGAAARPDVDLGRYLASECTTCHGAATATGTIPNLFGMAEATFAEVIKAYRDKRLPNPVMQNIASRLKDEEIEALAAYFAQTKTPR